MPRCIAATLVVTCAVLLAAPGIASAACPRQDRADLLAAMRIVGELRAESAPGASDAASVLTRARRSCDDARFAHAVAVATRRFATPAEGRRARIRGLDLISVASPDGSSAWRLDVARIAARVAGARTPRSAAALRRHLRAAGFGAAAVTWSSDSTRGGWDAGRQSAVAAALARSPHDIDRRLAGASVRAVTRARAAALAAAPMLEHLRIAVRFARAAGAAGDVATRDVAQLVAARAYVRVRAARERGWSRIGGEWSTLAQHRALVILTQQLLARHPHSATAVVLAAHRAALSRPVQVAWGTLPMAAFYPWPRDAAFDTQSVQLDIDKPATLVLTVYGPDGRIVRRIDQDALPGPVTLTWDGTATDGTTTPPGDYRYNVDARDRAGVRLRVAGLEQFRVARDTTAPTVRGASARYVVAGGAPRVIATWDVEEIHSPRVHTTLLLQQGERRVELELHDSLQRATVRRTTRLARGSWTVTFTFVDGSDNRSSQNAGTIVVR